MPCHSLLQILARVDEMAAGGLTLAGVRQRASHRNGAGGGPLYVVVAGDQVLGAVQDVEQLGRPLRHLAHAKWPRRQALSRGPTCPKLNCLVTPIPQLTDARRTGRNLPDPQSCGTARLTQPSLHRDPLQPDTSDGWSPKDGEVANIEVSRRGDEHGVALDRNGVEREYT